MNFVGLISTVPDFKEYLKVQRHSSAFGCNLYDYCITQEDLADGTFKILKFEFLLPIEKVEKVIDEWAPKEVTANKAINCLRLYGSVELTTEY